MAFGSNSHEISTQEIMTKVDTHSKALVSIVERQKDLEGKVEITGDKIEMLDHNIIKELRSINQDIKHLRDEIHDLKHEMEMIKEFESKVKRQFKIVTTKDEVQRLERYIDLWNPMQFATKSELIDIRDDIITHITQEIEKFLHEDESISNSSSSKNSKK